MIRSKAPWRASDFLLMFLLPQAQNLASDWSADVFFHQPQWDLWSLGWWTIPLFVFSLWANITIVNLRVNNRVARKQSLRRDKE